MNKLLNRRIANSFAKSLLNARIQLPFASRTFTEKTSILKNQKLELKANFKESSFNFNYNIKNETLNKDLPYVWLRNNCKCPICFSKTTFDFQLDILNVSSDVKPANVELISDSMDKDNFEVTWQDGHKSIYNLVQISEYLFENDLKKINTDSKLITWDKKSVQELNGLPTVNYQDYIRDDNVLKQALKSINKYGAVIVDNVPVNEKEIVKVCTRIAPIQNSIFGEGECTVTSQLAVKDRAYTNLTLKLHTDTTYLKNCVGLEAFHVIVKPEEGGESILLDGFHCAKVLKNQNPEAFRVLTTTVVQSAYVSKGEYDLHFSEPIIKLNPLNGELLHIRFNPYNNQNVSHLSANEMKSFHEALKKFIKILDDTDNHILIGLKPNQILIFDNFRLMHGRAAFKGDRKLITTYMPRDEWLSKAKVLNVF